MIKENKIFEKNEDSETLRFEKAGNFERKEVGALGDFGKVRNEHKCGFYRGEAEKFSLEENNARKLEALKFQKFEKVVARVGMHQYQLLGNNDGNDPCVPFELADWRHNFPTR
ncbi:hypothetical protein PanWU01x14_167580 [Parasponia andersonii]|uniref:Uncharacterized protein n=1 Tax=Parasponia andersonii TaxID=3476 RepID=A0A2P5CBC5_PARAD|nr:hypothetical protein PanWU01x14_167580 [Parasponia andersonii]